LESELRSSQKVPGNKDTLEGVGVEIGKGVLLSRIARSKKLKSQIRPLAVSKMPNQ